MPLHFPQMSTKEKLIGHVMKEEPVGSRNKVTVVGVGMVGMASAISVLLKVRGGKKKKEKWCEGKRRSRVMRVCVSVNSVETRTEEVYIR